MANRLEISDAAWTVIYPILVAHRRVRVIAEAACRAFLAAVLWVLRSGVQWRLLPAAYGQWNTVFKRFSRWCRHGVFDALQAGCAQFPDLPSVLIDSTVIRAHPCAAGGAGSHAEAEALGRSRGGFGTKIHAITDALGNPLDFVLTGGQASDIGQADRLLELTPEGTAAFVGDKGYDSDALMQAIEARDRVAVIPARRHRTQPRAVDWFIYKERHLIECFFNKIQHYRRIFSRFDKLARNYMGFLRFVSALIWLR
ncbi:MAG: IS5 family transposase [Methylococcaceae bacterium]|nr:IS5 family transposase [Methylococcaceae bacterium]